MAHVTREHNKLIFSKEAMQMLGIQANSRIDVKYWATSNYSAFPVIGLADAFGDTEGKRVTKGGTISFRGEQNEILANYGTEFVLEKFGNFYKLVKVENFDADEFNDDIENNNDLINW